MLSSATLWNWLDAFSSTIDSAVASNLGLVTDVAGFGSGPYNAVQTTLANKGSYSATGLNGRPCFVLAGNDVLDLDVNINALVSGTDAPFTCWFACKFTGTTSTIPCYLHCFGSNLAQPFHYLAAGDGASQTWITSRRDSSGLNLMTEVGGTFSNNTFYVIEHRFTGSAIEVNVNGVNQITDVAGSGTVMNVNRECLHGIRGIGSGLSTSASDLYLGARLLTSGNESPADRANMLAYLTNRWAP